MPASRAISEIRLVNGSTGDAALFVDYPGRDNALLIDAGENAALDPKRLADLEAVFLTHHHFDHVVGFDRIIRANLDKEKTLHVFGPDRTIERVYGRIKNYELPFHSFQKITFQVTEIHGDTLRTAVLDCQRRFREPMLAETAWKGPSIYENAALSVEAVPVEHTVPCLAYAVIEKKGYHPDPVKLASGSLKSGAWISAALELLRKRTSAQTELQIQGGRYPLGLLREQYFSQSPGGRIAFITDTAWTDTSRPQLVKLARGAWRLYCDACYAESESKQAVTHKHMTAAQAGELARLAKVEELVLIHFSSRYAGRYELLIDEARAVFPRVSADLPRS